jgi:hypothetical protein
MSTSYQAKDSLVLERQLKVQNLVIPFVVVGNSTPSSVSLSCDEGGFMFMRSQGVDQITPALDPNEVAAYTTSTSDSGGILQFLLKLRAEYPLKIMKASVVNVVTGVGSPCYLGSATGISTLNGNPYLDLMLVATLAAFNSSVTADYCLSVDYVINETQYIE